MMQELVLLGDCCEVTASPSSDLFADLASDATGTPVVTPADVGVTGRIEASTLRRLPETPVGLNRYRLSPGDLMLVRLGAVGRVALVEEPARDQGWAYHSSCMRIRPDIEQVDPSYLSAYLTHPPVADQLLSFAQVGTVPSLTMSALKGLPVALPDLRTQRLLAGALGEVAHQADIQRRMLARLDAVRQGLFTQLLGEDFPDTGASRPKGPLPERRAPRTRRTNRMS
ncbi:restriction endonuclease subunit S [Streptomyces sp. NPDC051561]|uniref:restriction endonuclease subunit S n=1 Tax=Streptomyces sp. NPDC051561 TaxID=3365658 RepID=UPI0037BE01DA